MKKLLFVTWDGPQTFYMEGLFMPIFAEIKKQNPHWEFHVLQFTWGNEERTAITKQAGQNLGVKYQAIPISRKPLPTIGSFWTLLQGSSKIKKYIQKHQIDVVMPRSTFPAYMVNQLKNMDCKVIFDADGLPIEERVDFSNLKVDSMMYRFLKSTETKMLKNANAVITRSQKSIDIHLDSIGEQERNKFFVVQNGRNTKDFKLDKEQREVARKELGLQDELLWVYAGSLGPQYCFSEMLEIVEASRKEKPTHWLILTGNTEFANQQISEEQKKWITIKSVSADKVPFYLNAGDIALALRKPTFSMQGVAPIKLGEYLLCGLPVIASKGIGDTEEILKNFEECLLYDHTLISQNVEEWIKEISKENRINPMILSEKAKQYFSLEAAAKSYTNVLDQMV